MAVPAASASGTDESEGSAVAAEGAVERQKAVEATAGPEVEAQVEDDLTAKAERTVEVEEAVEGCAIRRAGRRTPFSTRDMASTSLTSAASLL